MSDQSLRDALGEAWDDGNAVGLDGYVGPGRGAGEVDPEAEHARDRILDKLLAHPAEPASVVTDGAAQKAAERAVFQARYGVDWDSTWLDEAKRGTARQNATATASVALEAAAPLLGPRPLLDREALDRRLETAKGHSWSIETTVYAVMELARPMPTREAIAKELQAHYPRTGMAVASGVTCECGYWNGVESPGRDRPAGAQGRDGLNWHRAQVVLDLMNGAES